jgi:DNA-binding MarR family transcriptional regulator
MGAVNAAPRWLDRAETDAWVAFVGMLVKTPAAIDSELRRRIGLSHFEYLAMSVLSEAQARTMAMSELAVLSNATLSRLSHVITKLETRGWVSRTTCPDNRRVTNVTLTDAGFTVVVEAAPVHVELARSFVLDALDTDQVDQLNTIARQILRRVDPEGAWPPRGTRVRP